MASTSPSKPDNVVRTTTTDNRPTAQIRKQVERPTAVPRQDPIQIETEIERPIAEPKSPPIIPLKEQKQKELNTAKWWINKLIKDIEK